MGFCSWHLNLRYDIQRVFIQNYQSFLLYVKKPRADIMRVYLRDLPESNKIRIWELFPHFWSILALHSIRVKQEEIILMSFLFCLLMLLTDIFSSHFRSVIVSTYYFSSSLNIFSSSSSFSPSPSSSSLFCLPLVMI